MVAPVVWVEAEWGEPGQAEVTGHGGVEAEVFRDEGGMWGWVVRATGELIEEPEPWGVGREATRAKAKAKAEASMRRALAHYAGCKGPASRTIDPPRTGTCGQCGQAMFVYDLCGFHGTPGSIDYRADTDHIPYE